MRPGSTKRSRWAENPKWLQDDYVKFIRFAQMKIDGFTYKRRRQTENLSSIQSPAWSAGL